MARRRQDRWLLIRVAAQNVGRRRLRAVLLGMAVMLGVGVGFAGFVTGWALREGIAASLSRMGADLLVVPRDTLVNITSSLLTVQPTDQTLAADLAKTVGAMPGVARVAPQRIVPSVVGGQPANLIAFDPARDFSVLAWLGERRREPLGADGLIAGSALAGRPGEQVIVCGKPLRIYGRLDKTGVGPFDESYFLTFDALAGVAAFCRAAHAPGKAATNAEGPTATGNIADIHRHADAAACNPDLQLDQFRPSCSSCRRGPSSKR
jgi:putative ABC transport system permease protein